jgi:hypothetical protein
MLARSAVTPTDVNLTVAGGLQQISQTKEILYKYYVHCFTILARKNADKSFSSGWASRPRLSNCSDTEAMKIYVPLHLDLEE